MVNNHWGVMKVKIVMAQGVPSVTLVLGMKLLLATAFVVSVFVESAVAQSIPDNASPNRFGGGWICNRGYAQSGNRCVTVIPPENASLNYLGNGWQCNRGYYQSGQACVGVAVPEHAALDYLGHGWQCNRGFYQTGQSCSPVAIPDDASVDYLGHSWQCNRGFFQSGRSCSQVVVPKDASLDYLGHGWQCNPGFSQSGASCSRLIFPEHARLDWTGHDWMCDKGFKKIGNSCLEMTAQEVQSQSQQAAAISRAIQRRRVEAPSGDSCETEDSTGANVCVTATNSSLDCHKSFDGTAYRDCDVDVSYTLQTDYRGNSSLNANVDCTVELWYTGRNTVIPKTDSESDTNSHTLDAHDRLSESAEINFSFSSFYEVTRAKISSVECRIESVDLD
jgi:hypothetical protein